jgi:hypothetical protein
MKQGSRITRHSFPGKPGYIAGTCTKVVTELFLVAAVVGLLTLVWLGFDSDDDNGGGGLMQPVFVPVRSNRSQG